MSAGEHHWSGANGNGADDDGTCVDSIARRSASHALEEAQRIGVGLVETLGTIRGVEDRVTERMAIGFELLGIKDIRKRFARADAEREARREREQAAALASIPPYRPKTPSEVDRFERSVERFEQSVERISSHDLGKTPSDRALAKQVGRGFVKIAWDNMIDGGKALLIEHGVKLAIAAALGGGAGVMHLLHVLHVLK